MDATAYPAGDRCAPRNVSSYLKAVGIGVRPSGSWGRRSPAKPANEVITDSKDSKPANGAGVITDFIRPFSQKITIELPKPNPSGSTCEPFRETIQLGLNRGRNARQYGRTWSTSTASAVDISRCSVLSASYVDRGARNPAESSSPQPARKLRWTTEPVRWCAIHKLENTGEHDCSS